MDGLPGLEAVFRVAFPNAETRRCQVHAKQNALKRVSKKKDREAFKADLDRAFYAKNEAAVRRASELAATREKRLEEHIAERQITPDQSWTAPYGRL